MKSLTKNLAMLGFLCVVSASRVLAQDVNLSGDWTLDGGTVVTVTQVGNIITGTYAGSGSPEKGPITGNTVKVENSLGNKYVGTISGDTVEWEPAGGGAANHHTWKRVGSKQ